MAIPVAYALAFPERLPLDHLKSLSLVECGNLTFEEPDLGAVSVSAASRIEALEAGGTMAGAASTPPTRNWLRRSSAAARGSPTFRAISRP